MALNPLDLKAIQVALETQLKFMPEYLGDENTQFENGTFTPVAGQPYQKLDVIMAEPVNPEQGGKLIHQPGFFQVSLRYPANEGKGDALAMAQKIRDRFYYTLQLAANGVTVVIDRTPTIGQGAPDGDRYQIPVKIRFYANGR